MASTVIAQREAAHDANPIDSSHHQPILDQVERMVASSFFCHSKHYPALLRYVVEQTLQGRGAQLKERVVGFEVFGRDADYDTNLDPVVRNSACEVRKRIAQYYQEPGHEMEIRIEIPTGSYMPGFEFPRTITTEIIEPVAAPRPLATETPSLKGTAKPTGRWGISGATGLHSVRFRVAALVLAGIVVSAAFVSRPKDALTQFWGPVWDSGDSVILGMKGGDRNAPQNPTASAGTPDAARGNGDRIAFSDGLTLARITGLLGRFGRNYDIRREATFTLADMRREPAILVGGFNNRWTMRLEHGFRFTLEHDRDAHLSYIHDRQNLTARNWAVDLQLPDTERTEDYAIVSRIQDDRTEKMVVVVAGIGGNGTVAAGEFVTNERYMKTIASKAPQGWEKKNLQIVLGTELVNGNSGPPRVLAVQAW
jgi:hypothetical protein